MSSDEANRLMERKRKLDDELQGKLSTELSEMIKKSCDERDRKVDN
jgi:hypothetical protein